jgi:hypothetical protein
MRDWYWNSAWKRPWSSYGSPAYAVRNSLRPDDLVDDGGHVVVVGARAEEAQALPGRHVLREQALDVAHEVLLGDERLGQVERPVERRSAGTSA